MQMFCETEPERVLQELDELGITFSDYKETDIFTINSISMNMTRIMNYMMILRKKMMIMITLIMML